MTRSVPVLLLASFAWLGCPGGEEITGPDGEPLAEGECLFIIDVAENCIDCNGFETFDVVVTDGAGQQWEQSLVVEETWSVVVESGTVSVDYAAVLFGTSHPFGTTEPTCDRRHELTLGCAGFDFCDG